ncbi:MAG: quinohemoprotein amine dehydrogenase subunit beta [Proteobacteria bacterium]|nr:quinohemoprotein amine dehydrogenase subunit beta [Pseudomonadota bacterium]
MTSLCRLAALALAAVLGGAATAAAAGDLILTGAKPDKLYVIDAASRTIRRELRIPGANGLVGSIVPSPDGRIAYAVINRMESIVGVDLASGKIVFRADFSSPTERVKDFFAFALTPDGKELVAYLVPVRLLPSEYQVEQPRFEVFRTNAGLKARPVRHFEAPRRVHMLLMRPDGQSFYALGFDLYEYAMKDGKLLGTRGIQNWQLPGHSQPDLLAFWPVTEPTGVFTSPLYAEAPQDGKPVPTTALMSLDLKSGALDYRDFEPLSALIFSTVLSPDRKYAYGVYSTLTKVDVEGRKLAARVPLDHTYYAVNVSTDGREIYTGGAMCDVGFYDAVTLERRGNLKLPGCADQALASLRVIAAR